MPSVQPYHNGCSFVDFLTLVLPWKKSTVVQDETEIPYIIRSRLPLVAEYWNKCQWLFNIISLIRVSINLIKTEIFSSGSITNHMNRQHKTLKHTLTDSNTIFILLVKDG